MSSEFRQKRTDRMASEMTTSCRNAIDLDTRRHTMLTAVGNSMPAVNCSVTVANSAPPMKSRAKSIMWMVSKWKPSCTSLVAELLKEDADVAAMGGVPEELDAEVGWDAVTACAPVTAAAGADAVAPFDEAAALAAFNVKAAAGAELPEAGPNAGFDPVAGVAAAADAPDDDGPEAPGGAVPFFNVVAGAALAEDIPPSADAGMGAALAEVDGVDAGVIEVADDPFFEVE